MRMSRRVLETSKVGELLRKIDLPELSYMLPLRHNVIWILNLY